MFLQIKATRSRPGPEPGHGVLVSDADLFIFDPYNIDLQEVIDLLNKFWRLWK